jgi:hypothetical protein
MRLSFPVLFILSTLVQGALCFITARLSNSNCNSNCKGISNLLANKYDLWRENAAPEQIELDKESVELCLEEFIER